MKIITIDLETSTGVPHIDILSPKMLELFQLRTKLKTPVNNEVYFQKAPLDSEFGRIVAFSMRAQVPKEDGSVITAEVSRCSQNEHMLITHILGNLANLVENTEGKAYICGHNILNFDIPFLVRRAIYLGIPVPHCINPLFKRKYAGILEFVDSMQVLASGVYEWRVKLDLVCELMGIPSPKDNGIDGSQVPALFWCAFDSTNYPVLVEKDSEILENIRTYCAEDTNAEEAICLKLINLMGI